MAGSTVITKLEACAITVTHKIHFANPDKMDEYDFRQFQKAIKKQLEERWEKPDFKWKCCKVKFKFEYVKEPADDADTKNLRTDWKGFKEKEERHDLGRSFQRGLGPKQSTGEWFVDKPFTGAGEYLVPEAAHEVGHELGVDDMYVEYVDYDEKPPVKKIKEDPKGGYPKEGIMFNHKGSVQQKDIDEIMSKLGIECPKDCCH